MPTLPLNEAREALQRWGEELDKIVGAEVPTEPALTEATEALVDL